MIFAISGWNFLIVSSLILIPFYIAAVVFQFLLIPYLVKNTENYDRKTHLQNFRDIFWVVIGFATLALVFASATIGDANNKISKLHNLNNKIAECIELGGVPTVEKDLNFGSCTQP